MLKQLKDRSYHHMNITQGSVCCAKNSCHPVVVVWRCLNNWIKLKRPPNSYFYFVTLSTFHSCYFYTFTRVTKLNQYFSWIFDALFTLNKMMNRCRFIQAAHLPLSTCTFKRTHVGLQEYLDHSQSERSLPWLSLIGLDHDRSIMCPYRHMETSCRDFFFVLEQLVDLGLF